MPAAPRLSVVMPARNAAPYVDAAVASILGQRFGDFEFVVFDDGSTDDTRDRLAAWAARDVRVRVEGSPVPLGLVGSSNAVVRAARAPLVARMDADDVSHPDRLARQVALLDGRPDAVLVGTLFEGIDAGSRRVRSRDRWRLLRRSPFSPFPHGSIAFRRAAFEAIGGYLDGTDYWEDLSLYRRLATQGRVLVIPEALYQYRFHATNVRLRERRVEMEHAVVRMWHSVVPGSDRAPVSPADPRVQYLLTSGRLWAGADPQLLSRLPVRALATPSPVVALIFGVAAAAAISPRATRFTLAAVIAARDRLSGLVIDGAPREWHFA